MTPDTDDAMFVASLVPAWGPTLAVDAPATIISAIESRGGAELRATEPHDELEAVLTGPSVDDPDRYLTSLRPGGRLVALVVPDRAAELVRAIEAGDDAWLVTTTPGLEWGSVVVASRRRPRRAIDVEANVPSEITALRLQNAALAAAVDDARSRLERQAGMRESGKNLIRAIIAKLRPAGGHHEGA